MPFNQTFNNVVYPVPSQGDPAPWGPPMDRYLAALGTYAFSPAGGSYPLTADLNLGTNFGLIAAYYKSSTANIATAGVLRLAKTDSIDWRNNANSGNNVLAIDGSDNLTYNGGIISTGLPTLTDGSIWIGNSSNLPIARTLSGGVTTTDTGVTSISNNYITNIMVNSAAAIAYSKLNLSGSIVNSDIFSGAGITYDKLVTMSGDATIASGGALTLSTVNSNVGTFTLATVTVDAKGRITAASNGSAGAGTVTSVTGTTNQITSTNPTTTPVLALANPLTLPGPMTAGGAIAMGSNKITGLANGTVSTDAAAFGQVKVLQTVIGTTTSTSTSTSSTFVASVITVNITPTSSSSRILLMASGTAINNVSGNNELLTLMRSGTNILSGGGFCIVRFTGSLTVFAVPFSTTYIDSPASTSTLTYAVGLASANNSSAVGIGSGGGETMSIIAMEIV